MTRKIFLFQLALCIAVVAATLLMYPHLPDTVATHWNTSLEPDGFSPKWALFLLGPGVIAALTLLTYFGPWLSPRKFDVEDFRSTYNHMMVLLCCGMAYCFGIMLWAGAGHPVNAGRALVGGICLLFILLGNVMGKVRRNFFIGIRTPWSLASERVWNATHRLAAKTFVAGGLLAFALTMLGVKGWPIGALLAAAFVPAIYSLVLSKRLEQRGEL